jgi:hypothetical protein
MDFRQARDLDNYITGHYGADQDLGDDPLIEDEGYGILESAAAYLQRDDYPDWDVQEPVGLIRSLQYDIENDYRCQQCGQVLKKKNQKWCSPLCAKAAEL